MEAWLAHADAVIAAERGNDADADAQDDIGLAPLDLDPHLAAMLGDLEEQGIMEDPDAMVNIDSDAEALDVSAPDVPVIPDGPLEPIVSTRASSSRQEFGRLHALSVVVLEGIGSISYYESKGGFEARCFKHSTCTQSRQATSGPRTSGRPVGFLCAWLLLECSAAEHKNKAFLREKLTYQKRCEGRTYVEVLPSGGTLLSCERSRSANEAPEPESLQGLL
eukprot:6490442-Amphidinium_carterae.1